MNTTTQTKERPIPFSGEMVRAILDGRKAQTRRVIEPTPGNPPNPGCYFDAYNGGPEWCWWEPDNRMNNGYPIIRCPYGKPGERLWVRETWSPDHKNFYPHYPIVYRADQYPESWMIENGKIFSYESQTWHSFQWKPSIHMPRWASRILLEITGVRVERIQEITLNDVIQEGAWSLSWVIDQTKSQEHPNWKQAWINLWDQINAKRGYPWESNPWVWVIEFRHINTQTSEGE